MQTIAVSAAANRLRLPSINPSFILSTEFKSHVSKRERLKIQKIQIIETTENHEIKD